MGGSSFRGEEPAGYGGVREERCRVRGRLWLFVFCRTTRDTRENKSGVSETEATFTTDIEEGSEKEPGFGRGGSPDRLYVGGSPGRGLGEQPVVIRRRRQTTSINKTRLQGHSDLTSKDSESGQ